MNPFQSDPEFDGGDGPKKVIAADGHTYHKSATANASTAPTNEHTVANATQPKGDGAVKLSMDELDFVTVVHYHYSLDGKFPELEFLDREYGYETPQVKDFLANVGIRTALSERGVEFNSSSLRGLIPETPVEAPLSKRKAPPPLTPLQLVVANKLLDLSDQKSESKKLRDCGVTTTKFQTWMKDPVFAGYLRDRAESMLGEYQHEAMLSLIDQVRSGNMKAIQYMHEINGRYVTQASRATAQASNQNIHMLLVQLIEILEDEIDDNELAARIGDRIRGLISANNTASALMGTLPEPEVTIPETANAREITPAVQEMMNKGLGYQT